MKTQPKLWIKADAGGVREMRQPTGKQKAMNRRGPCKGSRYESQTLGMYARYSSWYYAQRIADHQRAQRSA